MFPVDFLILDMEEDKEVPIIFRKTILNNGKSISRCSIRGDEV